MYKHTPHIFIHVHAYSYTNISTVCIYIYWRCIEPYEFPLPYPRPLIHSLQLLFVIHIIAFYIRNVKAYTLHPHTRHVWLYIYVYTYTLIYNIHICIDVYARVIFPLSIHNIIQNIYIYIYIHIHIHKREFYTTPCRVSTAMRVHSPPFLFPLYTFISYRDNVLSLSSLYLNSLRLPPLSSQPPPHSTPIRYNYTTVHPTHYTPSSTSFFIYILL